MEVVQHKIAESKLLYLGESTYEAKMWSFIYFTREEAPLLHTEPGCSEPPPPSRRPPLAFPPRPGCGRRPEAN
jgi:hypothetical protein